MAIEDYSSALKRAEEAERIAAEIQQQFNDISDSFFDLSQIARRYKNIAEEAEIRRNISLKEMHTRNSVDSECSYCNKALEALSSAGMCTLEEVMDLYEMPERKVSDSWLTTMVASMDSEEPTSQALI